MARKRTELGPDVEDRIAALTTRGGTAESIAADPIVSAAGVSARTIGRRMRELRGSVSSRAAVPETAPSPVSPPPPPPASVPTSPEDIPDNASLPELNDLLDRAKALLEEAETTKNLPLAGQMIRVCSQLAETIRKATPPEPPDPNASPDMMAKGRETRERLHKAVDLVIRGIV